MAIETEFTISHWQALKLLYSSLGTDSTPRLLPTGRFPKHYSHGHLYPSEHRHCLRYLEPYLHPPSRDRSPGSGYLQLLVDTATLWPKHEKHVQCRNDRYHPLVSPSIPKIPLRSSAFSHETPLNHRPNRDGWGMIGIWTQSFGFHNVWEFWVYQTFYGLFVCPWYSYSQIMISEVTPRGKEFLFFSLFSIIGKTSSFIGPLVSSAIIDDSNGNNSTPFYFLFALSLASFALLAIGVDLKKSRIEQAIFLEEERVRVRKEQGESGEGSLKS